MTRLILGIYAACLVATSANAIEIRTFICFTSDKTQILQIVPDANDKSPQSASYFDGNILWVGEKIERDNNIYSISLIQAGLQVGISELATIEFSLPTNRNIRYVPINGPNHWPEIREEPFIFRLNIVGKLSEKAELFHEEMTCTGN